MEPRSEGRTRTRSKLMEWGVADVTAPGESESGDLAAVIPFDGGDLVGVVDGLGHGPEARVAAETAVRTLRDHPHEPVAALVQRCHRTLLGTRGAVMSLAAFNGRTGEMTWVGVGNVEGVLLRTNPGDGPARRSLVTGGGVVGSRLPTLHPVTLHVERGDLLVFATDGIGEGFLGQINLQPTLEATAQQIVERFAKGYDDGLVLVARYLIGRAHV